MADRSVPDYLKVEELYTNVAAYIAAIEHGEEFNETEMRRRLDAVHAMGKAIGRRSALDDLAYPEELKDLRHFVSTVRKYVRAPEGSPEKFDLAVFVDNHDAAAHGETALARHGFEDELINKWLRIVDGKES